MYNLIIITAYYIPRSNPDGVAITLACIPQNEVSIDNSYVSID